LAGLPIYLDLVTVLGVGDCIRTHVNVRDSGQGWTDEQAIVSLMQLNMTGGDCVDEIVVSSRTPTEVHSYSNDSEHLPNEFSLLYSEEPAAIIYLVKFETHTIGPSWVIGFIEEFVCEREVLFIFRQVWIFV
jgi:hypothetical protein